MTTSSKPRVVGGDLKVLRQVAVETPIGRLTILGSAAGVRAILWADEDAPETVEPLGSAGDGGATGDDEASEDDDAAAAVLDEAARQLTEYFAGQRTTFDLPLDLVGTEFQTAAWRALADVPFGTTVSYGEQARRLGRPAAVRAVGAANGRNPVPIVLPCHRIVGADGSLTGFGGGLDTKRWLLDHEQQPRLF